MPQDKYLLTFSFYHDYPDVEDFYDTRAEAKAALNMLQQRDHLGEGHIERVNMKKTNRIN